MTRIEALNVAIEALNGQDEAVEVLNKIKASIEKHNGGERKPTKVQQENEVIKGHILDYLATVEKATVKEVILLAEGCDGLSSQKVTALLTAMYKAGVIDRTVEKKVAYFSMK